MGFHDSVDFPEGFKIVEPRAGSESIPLRGCTANTKKRTNGRPTIKEGQSRPQTMPQLRNVPAPPPQRLPSRPLSLRGWKPFHQGS